MSKGCVCVLLSARASSGMYRRGNLPPLRPPFVVGAKCTGYWNMDQEYLQKHLLLLFCCCFGKVCWPQDPWLCGLVAWKSTSWRKCCPTAGCSPPLSSRPRSGEDPAHFAVSLLFCRDVGPSHQCDPAAVPFAQTLPQDFSLAD